MLDAGALARAGGALSPSMPVERRRLIVVEIGAYRGGTTVFMGRVLRLLVAVRTILSIDPFEGARRDALNPRGSLAAYLKAFRAAASKASASPLVGRSQEVALAVVPQRISALVLDGDHRYAERSRGSWAYASRLAPGGVCFVDDYARRMTACGARSTKLRRRLRFAVLHRSIS